MLDLESDSKLHILSGGTKVVQHSAPLKVGAGLKGKKNPLEMLKLYCFRKIPVFYRFSAR